MIELAGKHDAPASDRWAPHATMHLRWLVIEGRDKPTLQQWFRYGDTAPDGEWRDVPFVAYR